MNGGDPSSAPEAARAARGQVVARRLQAVLGHELRNPLAAALTNVETVAAMTDAADPRARMLQRAARDLDRVAALLDRYLGLGSHRAPRLERVSLRAAVASACRTVEGLVVELDGVDTDVRVDPLLFRRVLDNLLDNAARAGASRVWCRWRRRTDGGVHLEIRDNGRGVPDCLRATLFEPGVTGRGGTGLGLAVARDVMRAMRGDIRLHRGSGGARFGLLVHAAQED